MVYCLLCFFPDIMIGDITGIDMCILDMCSNSLHEGARPLAHIQNCYASLLTFICNIFCCMEAIHVQYLVCLAHPFIVIAS